MRKPLCLFACIAILGMTLLLVACGEVTPTLIYVPTVQSNTISPINSDITSTPTNVPAVQPSPVPATATKLPSITTAQAVTLVVPTPLSTATLEPGNMTPAQVETVIKSKVTKLQPLVLPANLSNDYSARLQDVQDSYFNVEYNNPKAGKTVRLSVQVPNPPYADTGFALKFRGVYAEYGAINQGELKGYMYLEWQEVGSSGQSPDFVPYYLTTRGLTDTEFWQIAMNLTPAPASPRPRSAINIKGQLRGVTYSSDISAGNLEVTDGATTYTVICDKETKIVLADGKVGKLSDLNKGPQVEVTGSRVPFKVPLLDAQQIKVTTSVH